MEFKKKIITNSNTSIPHTLIPSNNRSYNKQNRKEGKSSPQWLRKHRFSQSKRLRDRDLKAALTAMHPHGIGQRPRKQNRFGSAPQMLMSCSGCKNDPHKLDWKSLHIILQSPDLSLSLLGAGGVSLWHNLWQKCFPLGCFSFLVAKLRCSTQYQLSWGMCLQRWLLTPVQSKAGLSLFPR